MARLVTVGAVNGVVLPNGIRYPAGATAYLSDEEYSLLSTTFKGSSFTSDTLLGGNFDTGALITATGATTTQTGADQINYEGRGVKVVLNTTVIGTGSVTLEIDGKDTASGAYFAILTGAAVITNTTVVYTVYPGLVAVANAVVSDVLPRTWRVKVTANNANAATYTVGASVIV